MTQEWLWGVVLFAQSILFGMVLGLWFGLFRFLRLIIPHRDWVVAVEDLVFFLVASIASIFFHFSFGEGETRWFSVLGMILGFLFYLASLGKYARLAALWLKEQIARILVRPLRRFFKRRREKRKAVLEKKKALREEKKKERSLKKEQKKQEKEQRKKERQAPGDKT